MSEKGNTLTSSDDTCCNSILREARRKMLHNKKADNFPKWTDFLPDESQKERLKEGLSALQILRWIHQRRRQQIEMPFNTVHGTKMSSALCLTITDKTELWNERGQSVVTHAQIPSLQRRYT